jgi:hypothetical protein
MGDDFALWKMVCPITNSVFEEPVLADDKRTYSKSAMIKLIASYKARGLPITSPFGDEITEHLIPNENMVAALLEYRAAREQAANARRAGAAEVTPVEGGAESLKPVKSLAELGRMFSLLDGLRGLLAELLDGWQPPQIVVVGEESSGKSSVLERLMMTPLLPRDEHICTRLPIHVRLRRSDQAEPPRLEVVNVTTNTTERGPYVIASQSGAADVSKEMRKIIEEEQGGELRGVSASRIIIVHITSPDVPCLDLIDMPGLVSTPTGNEPADMASQTEAVVKTHMQSEHGSNSVYLAIVKATSAPNTSKAMGILDENNLYDKTLGVFTFCDEVNLRSAPRLQRWVRHGEGAVVLEPYGW